MSAESEITLDAPRVRRLPRGLMSPWAEALPLVSKYGFGTVAALFLLYKLATAWEEKLDTQSQKLDAMAIAFQVHQATMDRHAAEQAARDQAELRLQRAICYGVTSTAAERAACER